MRLLVTGGAGFIGSHIVDRLVNRGDDVVIIDDLSTGLARSVAKEARFIRHDITDASTVGLIRSIAPEIVIPRTSLRDGLAATIDWHRQHQLQTSTSDA